MSTRDQAIACITEKLRELAGIETALHANHIRATKELGGMSYQTYSDHREAAELHYVTADYYELLIEAITAIPLFDELDKQFPRDVATEAFVDVADAERYALRDEYVNATDSERTTLAEQLRALGAEQAAQDAEADAFHAQRRADEAEANGEHVDYAEAEAVREIEEEIALEAAGVESWDQL